ncbi:MAG TPA: S8 family serine peptidase [Steroidobacter sp.]|uniref:S8 family peptidase n=1 Tax=Steroidobacter sp. TaxID=1978227 RepID=UPI002ED9E54D
MYPSRILFGLSLAVLISQNVTAAEYNPARTQPAAASASVERVIVKLRDTGSSASAQAKTASNAMAALAGRNKLTLKQARQITSTLHVMQFEPQTSGESVTQSLARLRADSAVEYVEPDERRYPQAVPNDPLYAGQWYLQNADSTPSAIDAVGAWDVTTGNIGVVIADIDTGVLYSHPDLLRLAAGGRLLPGYDFVSDTAVANDGNGRDSDPTDPGDWVTTAEANSATFSGCSPSDSSWHGTRVAGILGALTNNSTGVAGVTWSSSILPVRVLGKCGGFDSDILAAMLWAGGIRVDGAPDNPYPAKIENLSLGSVGTTCPASYRDVVSQLAAAGVLVVASAGNEGGPVGIPARCPGVAAIAGLRHTGTKVGFSSLGTEIALGAPGGNCVNTGAGQPCLFSIDTTYNVGATTASTNAYTDQFNINVGTSFSAPIVSGIAGLMVAVNGNLNSSQLIARLKEGANPFPLSSDPNVPQCRVPTGANDLQTTECSCTTQACGAGMADANRAVQAALRPIAAVTTPTTVSAGQSITLSGGGSAASCNNMIASYAWTVVSGSTSISGSNTDTATIVAPSSGSYTVRLTVTDNMGRQDTADVVVSSIAATTTAPATAGTNACPSSNISAVTVSVTPASASIQAGASQTFMATVTNASDTTVTWQVNDVSGGNSTVGTISTAGVYTAPASVPSPATVTITAVSSADATRSASAQVTITAASSNSGGGGGGGGGALSLSALMALAALLSISRLSRMLSWVRH